VSALAVLLVAVGVGDVSRTVVGKRWLPTVIGLAALVACALLAGLWHLGDVPLLIIAALTCVGWLVSCERADRMGTRQATPMAVLGTGVVLLILLSGWGSDVAGLVAWWTSWAGLRGIGDVDPGRLLTIVGVLLVQTATVNHVVRLILGSVGAVKPVGQPQASDQLKGGRLLGPMERLLIVGLGLAGQLTMATAVVAAKSIIRFPEISANRDKNGNPERVGIDEVTEYFLVGSFASWLLAFAGLGLAQ
jgi:hypothetical protein